MVIFSQSIFSISAKISIFILRFAAAILSSPEIIYKKGTFNYDNYTEKGRAFYRVPFLT